MSIDIHRSHQTPGHPSAGAGAPAGVARFAAEGLVAELGQAERAQFRRLAALASPPNQVFRSGPCGLAAIAACCAPSVERLARHQPALALLPRVVGLAYVARGVDADTAIEEGVMTLRARGFAAWHAPFMVERAVQRGWRGLWVSGRPGFRRQVIEAARRSGLEAVSFDPGLPGLLG